ncbi:ParB/RepB/Spo0J family partition protein [Pseudomonas sp. MWU12-2323]|uniref:ParB/RepB/Spo0J family partition protein n=1 Tax=Pseudomonas sp. MWU12-2323 TaxID=2651296 RepID=UPI00128CF2EE|nr:ParB/RepB/Spo0J family partition protein [Pseudomonas sp. MWU12-2323]MPQ69309.1 chromosome partitioning protein ParB [Pseudomonas sp. MWU12-2323]
MNNEIKHPTATQTSKLKRNKLKPRRPTEDQISDMAQSIKAIGQIVMPIDVRPVKGGYEIVDGEIRWLGAIRLGMDIVPINVLSIDAQTANEFSLITNYITNDESTDFELNPEIILPSLERLVDEFGVNAGEIVLEKLAFLEEHNAMGSPEHQARAVALLQRCGIASKDL